MNRYIRCLFRRALPLLAGVWTAASLAASLPSLGDDPAVLPLPVTEIAQDAELPLVDVAVFLPVCAEDEPCADQALPVVGLCDGGLSADGEEAGVCPLPTLPR